MSASPRTEVLFVNHASLLIRFGDEYLLTDPWYQLPAFGSWLPIPPMAVHPAYLAALRGRLRILISHGHDDHCDDQLLTIFDKATPVITSDFNSKSVQRRVGKLGFTDVHSVTPAGEALGPFHIRSLRNETISMDDSIYLIETPDAVIIHCNDMWFPLTEEFRALLRERITAKGADRTLYASQTNSASGFPLTYRSYTPEQKRALLEKKVHGMIRTGLQNAASVGARYFLSYAGFATVFVNGHEEYITDALYPDQAYILDKLAAEIPAGLEVLDLRPGDSFDFDGIRRSFFGTDIATPDLKNAARDYYQAYGAVAQCNTYRGGESPVDRDALERDLERFLLQFDDYVQKSVAKTGFEPTVIGKRFQVQVDPLEIRKTVCFGQGLVDDQTPPNKQMIVAPEVLRMVLDRRILLENLYTGYNAEFRRDPADVYNRDIVMYLVMFSYPYRNRPPAASA